MLSAPPGLIDRRAAHGPTAPEVLKPGRLRASLNVDAGQFSNG